MTKYRMCFSDYALLLKYEAKILRQGGTVHRIVDEMDGRFSLLYSPRPYNGLLALSSEGKKMGWE